MGTQHASRWTAILLALAIAAGSYFRETGLGKTMHMHGALHYPTHVALFALLMMLLALSTRSWQVRWLLCLGVVLMGFGTEFYEHLKDGYPVEAADVLADALGAGIALLLTAVLPTRRHASRRTA